MGFNNKTTELMFCAMTDNIGELEHVRSHDYMIQQFYVIQPLEWRSFVVAVTALFICQMYVSSCPMGPWKL
jgi:hypothetical protein